MDMLVWFFTLTFKPFQYNRKSYVPKESTHNLKIIAQSYFLPLTWDIYFTWQLYVKTLEHRAHTVGPGISNLKKVDNLSTHGKLLTTFATFFPNAGARFLNKGTGEVVIYLQISDIYILSFMVIIILYYIIWPTFDPR